MTSSSRAWLSWVPVALAALLFTRVPQGSVLADRVGRMADALPLYLYAAAVDAGLDPIDAESLRQVYEAREMGVGAATWSTLYPATTGVVLRPLAALSWPQFETVWAWVLIAAAAAVGLLIPAVRPRTAARDRVIRATGLALMALFPATVETARLGQVNMLLAALAAGALVLVPRHRDLLGGLLLGLGASLKLVPAAVALPLFLGGRWRVAVGGCLVGLPALALASRVTPPAALLEGLRETSRFQSIITPAWLVNPALPGWVWHLGFTRHDALLLLTGLFAAGVALWRPAPGVLVGAGMLVLAWLGTDASVFHLLYTPLFAPAWLWLCVWALEPEAPRWTWPLSLGFAAAGVWMPAQRWWASDTTVACMLLGFSVWLGILGRVAWEAARAEERGPLAPWLERWPGPVAAALGLLCTLVVARVGLPGSEPEADARASGPGQEIQRTGAGFIDPEERPPGEAPDPGLPASVAMGVGVPQDGARRWPQMAVTGALAKGSRRHLDEHLTAAPGQWALLSERLPEPELAAAAAELGRSAPQGPLNQLRYQELAAWLAAEGVLLQRLDPEAAPELRAGWAAVLDAAGPR